MERQDRINLYKNKRGIGTGTPGKDELSEGIPVIRTVIDNITGQQKTVQYVKDGNNLVSSNFNNVGLSTNNHSAQWHLSREVHIGSGGTSAIEVIFVPAGTYILDIKILITSSFLGSYEIDIGDGNDTNRFINGWTGTTDVNENNIISPGLRGDETDAESGISAGYFYTENDTIDVLPITAPTNAFTKMRLLVLMLKNPIVSDYVED